MTSAGDTDALLAAIDADGAVREAQASLTRGGLLGGALLGVGALLAGRPGRAAAAGRTDASILRYALSLERLQAAFYTEAEQMGALDGAAATAAKRIGSVERAHVRAFEGLLGRAAGATPAFDFRGTTEDSAAFLKTAVALEDLAVAAYKGQAPRLHDADVLASAVGIHTVEARHAAWMRRLVGIAPAARAFDRPEGRDRVLRVVRSTRFVVDRRPRTQGHGRPSFTG
jgi:rubrerythrin